MDLDVFDDHPCALGEGPLWDTRSQELVWVDILGSEVHRRRLDSDSTRTSTEVTHPIGSLAMHPEGGWLAVESRGVGTFDGHRSQLRWSFEEIDGRPPPTPVRGNDCGVDPDGRLWFGTIAWDMSPDAAALYRLDDLEEPPVRVLGDVSISNGIGWSPDGATLYYIDSATRRIDGFAYQVDTGTASDRHPLVHIPEGAGDPDGLAVDASGAVWVALFGGGALHRYTPSGKLDTVLDLPVANPTSCAFIGADLSRLAVTSAHVELRQPDALQGTTLVVDVPTAGLPVPAVRG